MKYEIISEYEAKTPQEMAEELMDVDYIIGGAKVLEASIECGTDLSVTYEDEDGDEGYETISLSDIPDHTDYRACIGAVDEEGKDVIICIGY